MPRKTIKKIEKLRKSKELSSWLTAFSNNILPPIFFLFIAIVALYYIPKTSTALLRINLSIISLTTAALSLYIITLMF